VVVTVNDRGPHVAGRVVDLSRAAAERLGMVVSGLVRVRVEPADPARP
jgi:rare lipoprotein A